MEAKQKGKVQTVLGLINPQELGATVTHEHLLVDLMCYFYEPEAVSYTHLTLPTILLV